MRDMANTHYKKFTKEMKSEYTILAPTMLPIHFKILSKLMKSYGYNLEFYEGNSKLALEEGLKNVHNDMCYPALIVIGQLLEALKSGKYNPEKTALILSQTGGGCRASNYIPILRRVLKENGFEDVPVISINYGGEKHSGFKLKKVTLLKILYGVIYGDFIMYISNQCRPYEINKGETDKAIDKSIDIILKSFKNGNYIKAKKNYKEILEIFKDIKKESEDKIKVGIMGEIFMKYSPLGNSDLEKFLLKENCEVVIPGILDFFLYCLRDSKVDLEFYGILKFSTLINSLGKKIIEEMQNTMIEVIKKNSNFRAPAKFKELENLVDRYISKGVVMGEGWLITAEMLEFLQSGIDNIICAQPFGCLPNHIVGRGMNRKIIENNPKANIITVDYDPSASKVNQENRIKLMLTRAKEKDFFEF